MVRKLIISDLDGTLLDQANELSKEYNDRLNRLIEKGLMFSIATGRDLEKARESIPNLHITYPVILTNGALLGDLKHMKYLYITHFPPEIMKFVLDIAQDFNLNPMVFAVYDKHQNKIYFHKGKWGKDTIIPLEPAVYLHYLNLDVISIQFHTRKEILDPFKKKIENTLKDKVNLFYIEDVGYINSRNESGWYWLEINSGEAGKDKMLQYLANYLHLKMSDIVVFGDNYNDIEMIKKAGKGIAVANAPPQVKAVADEICPSNLEGGVIKYLEDHLSEFI